MFDVFIHASDIITRARFAVNMAVDRAVNIPQDVPNDDKNETNNDRVHLFCSATDDAHAARLIGIKPLDAWFTHHPTEIRFVVQRHLNSFADIR
jgi:hypothetical protein